MQRGDDIASTSPVAQPQVDALPTRLAILYRFEGQETRRLIRTWWDRPTLAPDELRALVVADGALGIGEPFKLRIWDEHFQAWFVPDEILLVRGLRSVPASGAVSSVSYAVDVLLEPQRPALTPALTGQGVAYLHQLPPSWPSASPIATSAPHAWLAASASGVAASHMKQPPPFLVAREQQSHSHHTDSSSLNEQQALYTQSLIRLESGRDGRPFLGPSDGDTPLGFEYPPSLALPKHPRPAAPAETPLANGGFPTGAGGNGRSCSGMGSVPPLLAEPEFSSGRDFSTYPTPPLVHMSSSLSHAHGYGGAQEPLQLALLHAAPLVWRHEGRLAPLDHQSLSLDFKAEVRAMWDMLGRTKKQVSVRFDVASSAFLGEALAMRPAALHLVCHADYDPRKRLSGASEEDSFFVGLEDAEGALDPLSLHRLRALLVPALVRSTRLVFVSACHSQPAAEAFVDAGVPHVIAVRTRLKVLDDAAALFARHLYLALVEGHTVRQAFDYATAQLSAVAPSLGLPNPSEEAQKFVLLPEWYESPKPTGGLSDRGFSHSDGGREGRISSEGGMDPHGVPLFASLPYGTVVERNPLPDLEPPYVHKPFLGRAIALQQLVLKLGQRRQKEVRLITLHGPAGVGKSSLALAAASHLFERRWFPEGCVRVELQGCETEGGVLGALAEALDMEFSSMTDVNKALKHWKGLLVLDKCDAAGAAGVMAPLLQKLLSTQELRVLCTARKPLRVAGEVLFLTAPLNRKDAARLFRELAMEGLPPPLRKSEEQLMQHPVLEALQGLPRAIWQTAPLLRQGKSMGDLELDLRIGLDEEGNHLDGDGSPPAPARRATTIMAPRGRMSARCLRPRL